MKHHRRSARFRCPPAIGAIGVSMMIGFLIASQTSAFSSEDPVEAVRALVRRAERARMITHEEYETIFKRQPDCSIFVYKYMCRKDN